MGWRDIENEDDKVVYSFIGIDIKAKRHESEQNCLFPKNINAVQAPVYEIHRDAHLRPSGNLIYSLGPRV